RAAEGRPRVPLPAGQLARADGIGARDARAAAAARRPGPAADPVVLRRRSEPSGSTAPRRARTAGARETPGPGCAITCWIFAAAITLSACATMVMLTSAFVALTASIAARALERYTPASRATLLLRLRLLPAAAAMLVAFG